MSNMGNHYDDRREYIQLQMKLVKTGFCGILNGGLVDIRIYPKAKDDLLDPLAVDNILEDLESELAETYNIEERADKKREEDRINDWLALVEELKSLRLDVDTIKKPYNDKIIRLEIERDKMASMAIELKSAGEKKAMDTCPHIKTKIEHHSVEGGYLDTGSHTRILRCEYCKVELDRDVTSTGYT